MERAKPFVSSALATVEEVGDVVGVLLAGGCVEAADQVAGDMGLDTFPKGRQVKWGNGAGRECLSTPLIYAAQGERCPICNYLIRHAQLYLCNLVLSGYVCMAGPVACDHPTRSLRHVEVHLGRPTPLTINPKP